MCASVFEDFDYEYVADDPQLGHVSCSDYRQARDYADSVDGEVYLFVWHDGKVVDQQLLTADKQG